MNRPRYMTVNEKSPYLVKRRVKGPRNDGANEPAITLLPLNSYTVIGGPDIPWTSSPRFYRAVAPKSAKNREASSFVILGEQSRSPVLSRPGSPSGRISPFRGHGFKTPTTTRPNSRANSPQHATSKKTAKITEGPRKSALENREKFNLYVGLPPKSPIGRSKSNLTQNYHNDFEEYNVTAEKLVQSNGYENVDNDAVNCFSECVKTGTDDVTVSVQEVVSAEKEKPCETEGGEIFEQEARSQEEEHHQNEGNREEQQEEGVNREDSQDKGECCSGSAGLRRKSIHKSFETLGPDWELSNAMDKLQPVDYYKTDRHESLRKSTPSSPAVRKKSKTEPNLQNRERTVKAAKPPMPPKKIGMKTTLKSNGGSDMKGKAGRGILKDRSGVKVSKKMDGPAGTRGNQKQAEKIGGTDKEAKSVGANPTDKILNGTKKLTDVLQTTEGIGPDKDKEKKEEDTTKMVPCYQPDKCNLAPPTMASPSPIITPSFSTPSTSADLAFNTTKNSQSISAAPTSVTSCSLSSVSSTVVLTGNLARKENPKEPKLVAEATNAEKKPEPPPNGVEANGTVTGPDSTGKDTLEMVKAGSRDRGKDKMSTEIASKTDVIKAQPDMEVLSPNNLRNSPPRMPPANVAWDENR
ncbi:hypothetical protein RUM44_003524 [Polyplax serrata]|uniref:Uncharacterized protein n=1 Tax=Polyplax serrata TaxID=468196 RepID=A0ABR1AGP6_POLSC